MGKARSDALTHTLIDYLMGEQDNVPKALAGHTLGTCAVFLANVRMFLKKENAFSFNLKSYSCFS